MPLLTQKEYAEHRKRAGLAGGTGAAVHYAIDAGRIQYEPGEAKLIDPEKADRAWVANTEPRPMAAFANPSRKKAKALPEPVETPPEPVSSESDYNVHRAHREFYQSELARLKVEQQKGSLVEASVVKKLLYEAGHIIRVGHEDIVSQLAPDLAAETNIGAVEKLLKARLDQLDTDLADQIDKLDERILDRTNAEEDGE